MRAVVTPGLLRGEPRRQGRLAVLTWERGKTPDVAPS
jgi:hypothetical protein